MYVLGKRMASTPFGDHVLGAHDGSFEVGDFLAAILVAPTRSVIFLRKSL